MCESHVNHVINVCEIQIQVVRVVDTRNTHRHRCRRHDDDKNATDETMRVVMRVGRHVRRVDIACTECVCNKTKGSDGHAFETIR